MKVHPKTSLISGATHPVLKLQLSVQVGSRVRVTDDFDLVVHEREYIFENSLLTRLYLNFDDPEAHVYENR